MEKVAIIGMGQMGTGYAERLSTGKVEGMELVACTRIKPEKIDGIKDILPKDLAIYQSGDLLYEAIDKGEIQVDTVIIVTPHYSHEDLAIKAFERGLNVLCDKPAGVYTRQARNMMAAYEKAKEKNPDLKYAFVFHQRTYPVYGKIKEIIDSKKYGSIKRINWVVTDWYRSNAYYKASAWRATWAHDGGGILLNQCPHNIDLLQWICGVPSKVQAFCNEGKYHDIEVEDDVTMYMQWDNGATGVFIASTGEGAGVNRLEISLDNALIICERGNSLKVVEMDKPELEYRNGTGDLFAKPKTELIDVEVEPVGDAYVRLLDAFVRGEFVAAGCEAINSMYITNAAYLSSWTGKCVEIPESGSEAELEFEKEFEEILKSKSKE